MATVNRSLKIDLIAPAELRQPILDSIRRYRHACREMYGVLVAARAAGAEIIDGDKLSLKPSGRRGDAILALMMGRAAVEKTKGTRGQGVAYTIAGSGAATGYDMRPWFLAELMPGAASFVWDSARRDVTSVFASGDPEFPKASRGWLALQGARGIAQFQRRGIGLPVATAKPALAQKSLTLNWDTAIGAAPFEIGYLEGGRYSVVTKICDGRFQLGTVFLSERDGKIFGVLSYSRDEGALELDPTSVLAVTFNLESPELFLTLRAGDSSEVIGADSAVAALRRCHAVRTAMESRRATCGNPNRSWGDRPSWRHEQSILSGSTEHRANMVRHYNHAWARRIMSYASKEKCGAVRISVPDGELCGHSWNWSQFRDCLNYKCSERGVLVIDDSDTNTDE